MLIELDLFTLSILFEIMKYEELFDKKSIVPLVLYYIYWISI